ncbi:GPALPP motifs-containing protein 1-like [Varroa jacobsoni]|uniref:GPALPP motifs-containing protein 1 n=1 Tax=Varroa destructor TaxID=109461 RepID=A0A7M7KU89_VARDE|nr:GPALPP motifs-containing protein 1-like [Varroa destructor]XP_022705721.1 GPALPP motifs-containing protein 1-like [Varroa jacobsoni]
MGPELPSHLRSRDEVSSCREGADKNTDTSTSILGPALPPDFRFASKEPRSEDFDTRPVNSDTQDSQNGQKRIKQSLPEIIGPILPPHLRHLEPGPSTQRSGSDDSGSSSALESDSDGEVIGPCVDLQGGDYDVRKEFEERQRRAEKNETYEPARESWMTELPRDRTGVRVSGTEARTFLKRGGEDFALDDSWTDVVGQKKRPQAADNSRIEKEQLAMAQRKRDAEIDASLIDYNAAKRSKALIDLHQENKTARRNTADKKKDRKKDKKKREKDKKKKKDKKSRSKKKKKDDNRQESMPERRPFCWEEDMRVSMVDTSRAKSMLDRTLLQSRFASGKTQKYL